MTIYLFGYDYCTDTVAHILSRDLWLTWTVCTVQGVGLFYQFYEIVLILCSFQIIWYVVSFFKVNRLQSAEKKIFQITFHS